MNTNLGKAKIILKTYNQEHLLDFYEQIDINNQEYLLNQIFALDFDNILKLYKASYIDEPILYHNVAPLDVIDKKDLTTEEINFFTNLGKHSIINKEIAIITLAGGQGTRLGYKGPKGTYELDIIPKKSLFEIQCDTLKCANKKYNTKIPWYIMTSVENDSATKEFFKSKDFFGYDRNSIKFFIQEELPLIDINGKLILSEPYLIKKASNGNGNVFSSLKKYNIINEFKNNNINWIFINGIDNILLETIDPLFLGLTISEKLLVGSKSILNIDNIYNWSFCKRDGKPTLYDCNNMDDNIQLYNDINILAHLFSIKAIEKLSNICLPYHRAFKKNAFINEEGMKQVPDKPNTFKFETFIFDSFSYFDNLLLLRVQKENEFAPIKSFTGAYTPETAKELYLAKFSQ